MKSKLVNQKKRIALLLAIALVVSVIISSCGVESNVDTKKDAQKYETAVANLKKTGLNEDGTYTVTEDLIVAIENEEFKAAKNIIYMIGDGMGANIIEVAQRYYTSDLYNDTLAINNLPSFGYQSTYSASHQVTDSAAGGTALSTGYKTTNEVIGMNKDATENYKNVLELAAEKGKSTGIVATKSVTDATPASFSAHVSSRSLNAQIAYQQLEKIAGGSLDIVLGGGSSHYETADNKTIFEEAKENGMTYTTGWEETKEAEMPLVGLFATEHMDTTNEELPTLAEMTDLALKHLSEDKSGFFLMVEGSQIDSYGHEENLEREAEEMYAFDQAIAIAMRFVALNPDTVLIITADHETGGIKLPDEYKKGELSGEYSSGNHSYTQVPVYALGYDTEKLDVIKENTDIAIFVASLMGEDEFGQTSKNHLIFDGDKKAQRKVILDNNSNASTGKDHVKLVFDKSSSEIKLLVDKLKFDATDIKNARKMSLVIKNTSEETIKAPALKYVTENRNFDILFDYCTYIKPGETKEVTYILKETWWVDDACDALSEVVIFYNNSTDKTLDLYDVYITERALEY